ncbi:MAG: CvpA family protein [bacterium]|nr:CvpA family protein [bacterium]
MSFFELILLIILGGFVLYGLWSGLIRAAGTLVGVIAGAFLAGRLFVPIAEYFGWLFGGNVNLAKVVIFFVLFVLINRLVGFGFYLIDKTFRIIAIIPFLKTINRLAGAIFGFLEGALVIGGVLWLAVRFPISVGLTEAIAGSDIARWLVGVASIIIPLLPAIVRELESVLTREVL